MSQIERVAYIDRTLREKGTLKSSEVAERFEVSPRRVKRDIAGRISYAIPAAESIHDLEDFTTICQSMQSERRLEVE